ncbi:MAG: MFS transporter [Lachnospiraceae bacterium]|nr:MFS transporter [Lachnospiraceae bacterium]
MKKNVTCYYGLITAVYSIGFVILSSFSSVYLLKVGLSSGGIGMLLALGGIVSALLQPLAGSMIDRFPKVSSKTVMLVCSIAIVIFGGILMLTPGRGIGATAVLYGIPIMLLYLAQPFINSLGMEAINYGYKLNFGVGRAVGSFGYAAGSYIFGIISVRLGATIIPFAFTLVYFLLCLIIFFYPVQKETAVETGIEKKKYQNPYLFLLKYKRFAAVLLGLVCIFFSHMLINTFSLQIILPKGGTSADMGTAAAIAAVCELITMLLFSFYMKKAGLNNLIKISGVFFTLKTLFSLLVKSVMGYFLIQGFQMFGFGLLSIGIVYYVNDLTSDDDKATGQAYAGIATTAGNVLATFLGGHLIDAFSVNTMLIVGSVVAAIGTLIMIVFVGEKKQLK